MVDGVARDLLVLIRRHDFHRKHDLEREQVGEVPLTSDQNLSLLGIERNVFDVQECLSAGSAHIEIDAVCTGEVDAAEAVHEQPAGFGIESLSGLPWKHRVDGLDASFSFEGGETGMRKDGWDDDRDRRHEAGEPLGLRGADRTAKEVRFQLLFVGFGNLAVQVVEKLSGFSASLSHASVLPEGCSTHPLRRAMAR